MPDYRHMRSGSTNIPNGGSHNNPAMSAANAGAPRFEGPRSPPNTSHVPCKFFRQGACQAGKACPFSHDLGGASETVCKYFAKGNCKFGPKCANIHVLPDGRRINYGKNGVTIGPAPIGLAGHSPHDPTSPTSTAASTIPINGLEGGRQNPPSTSALTNSIYANDPFAGYPFDDRHNKHNIIGHGHENGVPTIDAPYSSSQYGSPRDDNQFSLALSPGPGLSVLDAPLPASFDSNGISNAARYPAAPWPSSVPSKFGFESSSPSAKDARTSDTLKMLHTSAFGGDRLTPAASSPPNSHFGNGSDEYFMKRTMHSSRFNSRPNILSASVPKISSVDRDWQPDFAFDEDTDNLPENYVPENLQDLLTPAEKARRGSIRADDHASIDGITKYGSPIGTSPSRWAPTFAKDEELSRSARGASAFGHVGSPLRNSILAPEDGRPPTLRAGSESLSMLSQQLERSKLDDAIGSSPPRHLDSALDANGSPGRDRSMHRHVSSGSINSSMAERLTSPVNDDDPSFMFKFEDADVGRTRLWSQVGQPTKSSIGKGHTNGTNGTNGKKSDPIPMKGQ